MKDHRGWSKLVLVLALTVIGAAVSWNSIGAQSKGKPPKPVACNSNGICESSEYSSSYTPEAQPCADCLPLTASLSVRDHQILANGSSYNPYAYGKVFQYVCNGLAPSGDNPLGQFALAWGSFSSGTWGGQTVVPGDADNDLRDEVVLVANDITYETRKTVRYNPRIHLFKTGSTGQPDWTSDPMGESVWHVRWVRIGDVDNNGDNEIVVIRGDNGRSWVNVYDPVLRTDGTFGLNLLVSWYYSDMVYSLDVGDADNCGLSEIVLAPFVLRAPIIKKYVGGGWIEIPAEQCNILRPDYSALYIDFAKVRDSDNVIRPDGLKDNELVCGGNNNRLMIWKFDGAMFRLEFVSEDLGGWTQGVDAGDFDGAGENEVVAMSSQTGNITIFKFIGGAYLQIFQAYSGDNGLQALSAGDADGDGIDEICASWIDGFGIFDLVGGYGGTLNPTFSHPYGYAAVIR